MEVKQEEFDLVERELLRENHDVTTICKRTGIPEEKVVELVDIVTGKQIGRAHV